MPNNFTYNVLKIIRGTTVDGPGFRTSIYLAGCSHHCPGCHNPQSWNPDAGEIMTLEEIMDIVREEDFNVTLTGGDPLYNPAGTSALVDAIITEGYSVWIYTGYTLEEISVRPDLLQAIKKAEMIVEGRFMQNLRDTSLLFRGSSNQRIVRPSEIGKAD